MTSQLQRRFSNNITTLCRRLLSNVFFAMLLRRDMVERRRDLRTTSLQRRHDVVCLLGSLTDLLIKVPQINYFE